MPVIDLTGQRFGKLTVIERDLSKTGGAAYWKCRCDCGNERIARSDRLRNGEVFSCGCEKRKTGKALDTTSMIGKRFERLVVLERDLSRPHGKGFDAYWKCQCDCGKITSVSTSALNSGTTKSCGCYKSDMLHNRNVKDITNQRFGLVVAKENTYKCNNHGSYIWRCECDCGNKEYYASTENLLSGRIVSCGCHKMSKGEIEIATLLTEHNIKFKREYTFSDLKGVGDGALRFDFALLDNNEGITRLVEFDGE